MDTRKEPSYNQLTDNIALLKNHSTTERKETISHLDTLSSETKDPKIILGGAVFEAEKIRLESRFFTPKSKILKEINLHILEDTSKKPLSDQQKFIYLWYFYLHQKTLSDDATRIPDSEFRVIADSILYRIPELKTKFNTKPKLQQMTPQLTTLPSEYKKKCQTRWFEPNPIHRKFALLIQFLSTPAAEAILLKLSKAKNKEDDTYKQFQYTVGFALPLYTMLEIENEYSGTLQYPTNSELYKFCQEILNIHHTQDVLDIEKLNFFLDLRQFMQELEKNESALEVLEDYIVSESWGFYRTQKFSDAKSFVSTKAKAMEELMTSDSFIWSCTKNLVNYAVLTGLGLLFWEGAAAAYGVGLGAGIIVKIGEKLGAILLGGPLGAYFGAAIGVKYEKDAVVGLLAGGFMLIYRRIQDVISGKKSMLDEFEAAEKFRNSLQDEIGQRRNESEARTLLTQIEWNQAAAELPSTLVPQDMKDRIQKALAPASASLVIEKI